MLTTRLPRNRSRGESPPPSPDLARPPAATPARPTDPNTMLPSRDVMRARNWLERYAVCLTRNDKPGMDTARRALKELGVVVHRCPPVGRGVAS